METATLAGKVMWQGSTANGVGRTAWFSVKSTVGLASEEEEQRMATNSALAMFKAVQPDLYGNTIIVNRIYSLVISFVESRL